MSNQNHVPALALNFSDLTSLRHIIRAYIPYTRRVSKPTRERGEQIHMLESLSARLTNIPVNMADMALLLSVAEVFALDCALAGFCDFVRRKVPPSRERDETLQDIERMRQVLAQML